MLNVPSHFSPMGAIVPTKCFVLNWSIDLDYQMCHYLPREVCTLDGSLRKTAASVGFGM
ncbi:hypothetical protein BJX62DRAFT_218267, partial [Aspergillus germanicus]